MNRTMLSACILLLSVLLFQGCATLGDFTYPERITIISKEFR
jgi:hypothetical protein